MWNVPDLNPPLNSVQMPPGDFLGLLQLHSPYGQSWYQSKWHKNAYFFV